MRKLRFTHGDQGETHKKGWRVSKRDIANLAIVYGIVNRDPRAAADTHARNVTTVTDGHNVTQRETSISVDLDLDSLDNANALAWQAQAKS